MIHDIRPEYFALNLNQYRLTFDDGLFSQYYYFPLLKNDPGELTYFITTAFIQPGKARSMYAGKYVSHLKPKKYNQIGRHTIRRRQSGLTQPPFGLSVPSAQSFFAR